MVGLPHSWVEMPRLGVYAAAELSAQEIVRRAERCIGLAIRKGQAEGKILKYGDNRFTKEVDGTNTYKKRPSEFAAMHELAGGGGTVGYYDLADGVTDEAFDEAIEDAKAERNLSRANVVRKVRHG